LLEIFASLLEGLAPADVGHHAAYPRAERAGHHIQPLVFGHHTGLTGRAMVVGPSNLHRRHHRRHGLVSVADEFCPMALRTLDSRTSVISSIDRQQLAQQDPADLVHAVANRHLQCFQIQAPAAMAVAKCHRDQPIHLLLDDLYDFFYPCGLLAFVLDRAGITDLLVELDKLLALLAKAPVAGEREVGTVAWIAARGTVTGGLPAPAVILGDGALAHVPRLGQFLEQLAPAGQ
jgi:hypothetical protein